MPPELLYKPDFPLSVFAGDRHFRKHFIRKCTEDDFDLPGDESIGLNAKRVHERYESVVLWTLFWTLVALGG